MTTLSSWRMRDYLRTGENAVLILLIILAGSLVLWIGLPVIGILPIWFYPRSKTVWVWFDLRTHLDAFGRRTSA